MRFRFTRIEPWTGQSLLGQAILIAMARRMYRDDEGTIHFRKLAIPEPPGIVYGEPPAIAFTPPATPKAPADFPYMTRVEFDLSGPLGVQRQYVDLRPHIGARVVFVRVDDSASGHICLDDIQFLAKDPRPPPLEP